MIKMNDIVREGDPVLREKASDVPLPASNEDKATLASLIEYVQNSQNPDIAEKYGLRPGIGLAAPQIGISKRMIAIHLKNEKGEQVSYALFNPKVVSHSVEKAFLTSGEGCLSVDRDVPGYVHRYARVTVKGTTIDGDEIKFRLKGLPAICIQHEIDHLNGIMFYDYINKKDPFHVEENAQPIER
ncbi:peptide deformylase [Domibacillus epiphyticus]|uniref:Peptide deformylase n=1 Tax=Domibacillus epiphyticus TaxID=1714355 RepID=A0A1V2ACF3_9BACI|nr:peptide deformylase [Domibacillus epiphyticus]OMP68474.1 peptide deformylase [Domibacillus epiphyticus]